jgi:hypothetical protein
MNPGLVISALFVSILATGTLQAATPLGSGFTYQGQLKQNGSAVTGAVTMRFSLWDSAGSGNPPVGGTKIGASQVLTSVPVTAGLFTVTLNAGGEFGADPYPFYGDARWLQAEICADPACAGSTALGPRQPLTAVPYALETRGLFVDLYGRVGIGAPSPAVTLYVRGDVVIDRGSTYGASLLSLPGGSQAGPSYTASFYKNAAGNLAINNNVDSVTTYAELHDNGTWTASSDLRLKADIEPLCGLLDAALELRPVSYYLDRQDFDHDPRRHIGFIGQEVEPLLPSLVYGSGEEMRTLDYSGMSVVAIGAIQEQQRLIGEQRDRIRKLESDGATQDARIAGLANRLERLEEKSHE